MNPRLVLEMPDWKHMYWGHKYKRYNTDANPRAELFNHREKQRENPTILFLPVASISVVMSKGRKWWWEKGKETMEECVHRG